MEFGWYDRDNMVKTVVFCRGIVAVHLSNLFHRAEVWVDINDPTEWNIFHGYDFVFYTVEWISYIIVRQLGPVKILCTLYPTDKTVMVGIPAMVVGQLYTVYHPKET